MVVAVGARNPAEALLRSGKIWSHVVDFVLVCLMEVLHKSE
jgi:hypothetical protein